MLNNLLCTVQWQTSIIEVQNRRLSDIEKDRRRQQLLPPRRPLSPPRNIRGESPCPSRLRSPRHSASVRSPTCNQRLPSRRSPGRSPSQKTPPRRKRRSQSSSYSEDDNTTYNSVTQRIRVSHIPRRLEKPPQMDPYHGTTDPDEHIENVKVVLTYREVRGMVCRFFVTTFWRGAMTWYKTLRRNFIDSWGGYVPWVHYHFKISRT